MSGLLHKHNAKLPEMAIYAKLKEFERSRFGNTGTKEWSEHQEAGFLGCSNNCRYCYSKRNAKRFGWKEDIPWRHMTPNYRKLASGFRTRDGITMYPNSHGITTDIVRLDKSEIQALYDDGKIPKTGYMELMDLADKRPVYSVVDLCIFQLKKLLKPGNFVMITTKPDYFCVQQMMEKLSPWKDHILFRFTITSRSDTSLQHWEPHAPNFFERKLSLLYAYLEGWATSVSMEPFLDPDPVPLLLELEPYVTETLWIGKLNYHSLAFNSNDAVKAIARRLLSLPERIRTKLRMKDSFQEVCGASTPYITKDNLLEVDA